jgi:hypothetical protein
VTTTISIVGGAGVTVGAGETFPLVIPQNVHITTQTGAVKVQVPTGKAGFGLASLDSSIAGTAAAPLTITTTVSGTPATGGTNGIVVADGASAFTVAPGSPTSISDLTVTGMLDDGILVQGGSVAIGAGVVSTANGVTTATRAGLHVTNSGIAVIDVPSGSAATTFNDNTAHGILVDRSGSITVTGSVTDAATGTGTVETNGNVLAGVWIEQTPINGAPPLNSITGLVSFANTGGNGMHLFGGSHVLVRSSAFLNNSGNGVIISTYGAGTPTANNSVANIDLGTSGAGGSSGLNTFQAAFAGAPHNGGSGICLATANGGASLNAAGNQFSEASPCTSSTQTLTLNTKGCGNVAAQCASGVCDLGLQSSGTGVVNSFNVSTCVQ